MSDQGAGGGIESGHMSTHARSKSDNDAVPTEAPVEAGPSTKQTTEQTTKLSEPVADWHRQDTASSSLSTNPPSPNPPSRTASPVAPAEHNGQRVRDRPVEPPVTRATLGELDVAKIIHNPKLRHDINFDPELHFRPNLDGEKGRRKQEKANQFWNALRDQLTQFVTDPETFVRQHPPGQAWCLPDLLSAVREIIETLVPQRDRDFLEEGLNVDLLMQQFNKGSMDLEKLAAWLSGVLKLHCAPMRDDWVDEMYNELSNGNRNNDIEELVKGMRSLLSVLEAMKLDVANHQIRCLRAALIEDTINFEQRFFYRKLQSRKLDIGPVRAWYDKAVRDYSGLPSQDQAFFGDTAPFFEALSKLVMPSKQLDNTPHTFLFDEERILKLRSDMLDAINLEVCMRVYEGFEKISRLQFSANPPAIPSYVMEEDVDYCSRSSSEFDSNTPSSRPSSLVISNCGSSPRNSGCFSAQLPADMADARAKAQTLYSSLLALLQTAPAASRPQYRWDGLAPSMALQIFRSLNLPTDMLDSIERSLISALCNHNELHQHVEEYFHAQLYAELGERVKDYMHKSCVALFSVAAGGRIHGPGQTWDGGRDTQHKRELLKTSVREAREQGGVKDMAMRLAHLGILHWKVWAPLAYVGGFDRTIVHDVPVACDA